MNKFLLNSIISVIYNFSCCSLRPYKGNLSSFLLEWKEHTDSWYYFQMGQWHPADEYEGQVREITFRSLCSSPMCPPDTAMTEYQHYVVSPDKKMLV